MEFRRGRALFGFMSEQDAGNFLNGLCVFQDQDEFESYKKKWAPAADSVSQLKLRVLSPVNQRELSPLHSDYVKQLTENPGFRQIFRTDFAVREVELERVIAFQRHIDTEYAEELANKMASDDKYVMDSCLPLVFKQEVQVSFDQTVPGVTFSSVSPKLQLGGLQIIGVGGPEVTIGGQRVQQPGVIFLIGTQPNYVQVVEYESRYFLKNGYHRAYAALLSNRKQIPAVVYRAEDFATVGALNPAFFSRELLLSAAPPLLCDFLNEKIAVDVKLKPMRKILRARVDDFFAPR
jgi:hypothetical protein